MPRLSRKVAPDGGFVKTTLLALVVDDVSGGREEETITVVLPRELHQ